MSRARTTLTATALAVALLAATACEPRDSQTGSAATAAADQGPSSKHVPSGLAGSSIDRPDLPPASGDGSVTFATGSPVPASSPVVPQAEPEPVPVPMSADTLFEPDSATLSAAGRSLVADLVARYGTDVSTVCVAGYTDWRGSEAYNLSLSDARAAAVRVALIDLGVAAERVFARGFGEATAVQETADEALMAADRRVDVTVFRGAGQASSELCG